MSMNTFTRLFAVIAFLAVTAFGQVTTTQTTLSAAVNATDTLITLTSATGVSSAGPLNQWTTELFVDRELMQVRSVSGTNITVQRGGESTPAQAHNSGAVVWVGPPSYFGYGDPSGACVATAQPNLPRPSIQTGRVWTCPSSGADAGVWLSSVEPYPYQFTDGAFWVPASACGWSTTGTWASQVAVATGGPNIQGLTTLATSGATPLVNQISLAAAASANTLNCTVTLPQRLTAGKGVVVTDVTVMYGVQTTALTSISGAALSTITYPTGASQTASTVTPVAITGTVTASSTTGNLGLTTAGAFRSSKLTLATPFNMVTDLQQLIVTEVFNQSAASAQIVNTPGVLVHYTLVPL